ncbi:metal ABC transporter substrate-binding protein [Bradyrhizobium lablabi]|uniref:metal ABC transporter substrate-binding protein n=1 Tax=Bradyrhizobium lablabi TaxID=722472 RepID=UPI001BA8CD75|nr:metal ABC transporter substrate-binding protein [Bradyrhizobium lablabi]
MLAALVAATSPSAQAQQRLLVITTSPDLKSLVEAVGGDRVEVESLGQPEQNPHSVEIKPGQLVRVKQAAMLVRIGLDHEPWLARLPALTATVVDASRDVPLLQTETPRLRTARKAHTHAYGNTHYWLDPKNAWPITASILAALADLSPADRAAFEARREAFLSRLEERLAAWEGVLAPYRGARVVVVHDSWSYFAERFGLRIVAAAEPNPGVPPSPGELAALLDRLRGSDVRVLISDPHSDPSLVRQIADKGGVRPVTLLPSGRDYIGLFEENVQRLSQALKSGQ